MSDDTIQTPASETSARALLNNAPTPAEAKANSAKPRNAKPAKPAMPTMPKPLPASATPSQVAEYIKAMRIYNEALKAALPKRTKAPVISDKIKTAFFKNGAASSEEIARRTGTKLVTVKTFRGDAVNTFKNADAAGFLSPAGKKWLEQNRKK